MLSLRSGYVYFVVAVMLSVLYILSARPGLNTKVKKRYPLPSLSEELFCENILANITVGKWIRKLDLLTKNSTEEYKKLSRDEELYDKEFSESRIERGIHTRLWRDDFICGSDNFQEKPVGNHWGVPVGGWCNAKSDKPCCSDEENGVCGTECECPRCVDMRKIYHAQFSEWTLSDARCKWRNYTAEKACDVISRFSEIQFIGDSLVRQMARGLMLLLRSDPNFGAMSNKLIEKPNSQCTGEGQFYGQGCSIPNDGNFKSILADQRPLCGMSLERFSTYYYGNYNGAQQYLDTVKRLAGKAGSVLVVGFGVWRDCNSQIISKEYMDPVVKYLEKFYQNRTSKDMKWPLMIFATPDSSGVLKAKIHRPRNGNVPCDKFAEEMETYCNNHGIPILDVRKLTYRIHSFDGTHHALTINIMKNQFMLNYLDSVSVGKNWSTSTQTEPEDINS